MTPSADVGVEGSFTGPFAGESRRALAASASIDFGAPLENTGISALHTVRHELDRTLDKLRREDLLTVQQVQAVRANVDAFVQRRSQPEQLAETTDALRHLQQMTEKLLHKQGNEEILTPMRAHLGDFLTSLSAELADERYMHQGDTASCPAAIIHADLAATRPGEYLRLWEDLASKGQAQWACGTETIVLDTSAFTPGKFDQGQRCRGMSSRLFQASAMGYGVWPDHYDAASDTVTKSNGETYQGCTVRATQRLENAAFNHATVRVDTSRLRSAGESTDPLYSGHELLDMIERSASGGQRVRLGMIASEQHAVSYAGRGVNAAGQMGVWVRNPWSAADGGGLVWYSREDFAARLLCAYVEPTTLPESDARRVRTDIRALDSDLPAGDTAVYYRRPSESKRATAAEASPLRRPVEREVPLAQRGGEQGLRIPVRGEVTAHVTGAAQRHASRRGKSNEID